MVPKCHPPRLAAAGDRHVSEPAALCYLDAERVLAPRPRIVGVTPALEVRADDPPLGIGPVLERDGLAVHVELHASTVIPAHGPHGAGRWRHRGRDPDRLTASAFGGAARHILSLGVDQPEHAEQPPVHASGAGDVAIAAADDRCHSRVPDGAEARREELASTDRSQRPILMLAASSAVLRRQLRSRRDRGREVPLHRFGAVGDQIGREGPVAAVTGDLSFEPRPLRGHATRLPGRCGRQPRRRSGQQVPERRCRSTVGRRQAVAVDVERRRHIAVAEAGADGCDRCPRRAEIGGDEVPEIVQADT